MGALFHDLVKTGVGQDIQSAHYFNSPQLAMNEGNRQLAQSNFGAPTGMFQPPSQVQSVTPGDSPDAPPTLSFLNPQPQMQAPDVSGVGQIQKPSFLQASADKSGMPSATGPALTKGGRLLAILRGAASGAAAGAGTRTFGEGFQQGQALPFLQAQRKNQLQQEQIHNQLGQAQVQMLPWQMAAAQQGVEKTQSEINKNKADYVKNLASAAKDNYLTGKDGAIFDLSSGKPVPVEGSENLIPLDANLAQLAGIPEQAGKLKSVEDVKKLKDMADAGLQITSANGRQIVYDKLNRKAVADLGVATPVMTTNMRIEGMGQMRAYPAVDNTTGKPVFVTPNQINTEPTRYTPASSDTELQAAIATAKDAATGNIAKNARSLNTAIGHLEQLQKAGEALNNNNWQVLNKIGNAYNVQTGKSAPVAFNAVKNAVAGEVAAVFKSSGATDTEISSINQTFSQAQSPEQMKAALAQVAGLLGSRLKSLEYTYEQNAGKHRDLISPEARSALRRLGGGTVTTPAQGDDFWSQFPEHK